MQAGARTGALVTVKPSGTMAAFAEKMHEPALAFGWAAMPCDWSALCKEAEDCEQSASISELMLFAFRFVMLNMTVPFAAIVSVTSSGETAPLTNCKITAFRAALTSVRLSWPHNKPSVGPAVTAGVVAMLEIASVTNGAREVAVAVVELVEVAAVRVGRGCDVEPVIVNVVLVKVSDEDVTVIVVDTVSVVVDMIVVIDFEVDILVDTVSIVDMVVVIDFEVDAVVVLVDMVEEEVEVVSDSESNWP